MRRGRQTNYLQFPGRSLDGEKTLQEELIKEKDELILIRRRLKEPSDNTEKDTPVPEVRTRVKFRVSVIIYSLIEVKT